MIILFAAWAWDKMRRRAEAKLDKHPTRIAIRKAFERVGK